MPRTDTHPCPGGCGTEVTRERLSCLIDWARLPKPLRDEITAAYRQRFRGGALRHAVALSEAFKWYRANPPD